MTFLILLLASAAIGAGISYVILEPIAYRRGRCSAGTMDGVELRKAKVRLRDYMAEVDRVNTANRHLKRKLAESEAELEVARNRAALYEATIEATSELRKLL